MLTLGDLHIGQDAIIRVVGGEGELRHHLLDMGLTPGTEVTLRKTAPMGDPIEVELRGYELTLRLADAQKIEIDSVHATDRAAPSEERHKVVAHPGVGELGLGKRYYVDEWLDSQQLLRGTEWRVCRVYLMRYVRSGQGATDGYL